MSNSERLITYFVGKDEINPALNQINGGLSNTGRKMEDFSKRGAASATMLGREWQKFQRHFGYAMAGLGTYEIFNAVSKLRDYQSELASLNAVLGTTPGELNKFGQAAIDISTKTAQPLNDVLASMNNIATSIPNMSDAARKHLIPTMAMIEAMGSKISGTDPKSFGSTVLGLATAFYGRQVLTNPATAQKTLESIASKLITTQFSMPNPTSQTVSSYIPMLTAGAATSGFTLDQMLSLFTVSQRIIQRPSTTAQYLRQLMIRLHTPTKAEAPFFAQAGLDPQTLAGLNKSGGGMQILRTIIGHALTLGQNNLGGMTPEAFMAKGDWKKLQLSPEASQFIQNTIGGRIQSLVAARAITAGLQQIPIAEQSLNNGPSIQDRFKQMDFTMAQAQQAISNMTTQIGTTWMPAIDALSSAATLLSGGVSTVTNALNNTKDTINRNTKGVPILGGRIGGATEIAALVAAGFGGRALARSSTIKGLFSRGSGAANAALAGERGLLETEAASHALVNQANGTPSSPFWVVIHPLSMSQIPLLAQKSLSGLEDDKKGLGSSIKADIAKGAGAAAVVRSAITKLGGRGLRGAKILGGDAGMFAAEAPAIPDIINSLRGKDPFDEKQRRALESATNLKGEQKHLFNRLFRTDAYGEVHRRPGVSMATMNALVTAGVLKQHSFLGIPTEKTLRTNVKQADAVLGQMFRLGPGHQLNISRIDRTKADQGYVEATLTLEPTQEFKNLLKPQQVKVHIPISEASPAPTSRGKARTARTK